jgi:nucleotide-binding universal stress UspA family protein
MKLGRILCPIDFSDGARHALEHATVIAGFYRSRIDALHVVTPLMLTASGVTSAGEELRELDRLRRLTSEECAAATSKGISTDALVDIGQPGPVIVERAATLPADLIVMGTHGISGFQRLVLGSVTEHVLRKAACPVLTVRARAHVTARVPYMRVLCAVDFSDASMNAARWASSLAQESGAALVFVHVLEWPWEEPPPPTITGVEQAGALAEFRRYSEEAAKRRLESLVPDSIPASRVTARVENGKPHVQIVRVAEEEQADVIVIGVHGRNPVDMALFGSTTNQVVRRAPCPVLTLRR